MKSLFLKLVRQISRLAFPKFMLAGIDIQDQHMAGVVTLRRGDKITIASSGVYDVPESAIVGGEITEPDAVKVNLRALLGSIPKSNFKFALDPVFILSVPSHHLYTETAVFPPMERDELESAVRLKAEASLPWPLEEAYFDWTSVAVPEKEQEVVFIAAVNKKTISNFLQVTSGEEWRVGAMEFHILSLAKFVDQGNVNSFVFALIDEDGIEFAVFLKGTIVAHYLHKATGEGEISQVLESKMRQLTSHVEGNLGFSIDRIFVFDRISREQVLSTIRTITGIPTQPFLPDSRPEYSDPRLLIAHGAAFRLYSENDTSINLIPPEFGGRYQENLVLRTVNLWIKVLFVYSFSFLVAFAGMFAFLKYQNATLNRDIRDQSIVFERLIPQSQPLIEEAKKFNSLVDAYYGAKSRSTMVGKKIGAIMKVAQETGVGISGLSFADGGIAGTFTAPTKDAVLEFKRRIEEAKIATTVTIPLTDLSAEKNLTVNALLKF